MQTLEQVLETLTQQLHGDANDGFTETRPVRYAKAGDMPFEQAACITADALCAMYQSGNLGDRNWPQFVDHYAPEQLVDGKWEYLDIQGQVIYVGWVWDHNHSMVGAQQYYVWTFSYSELGCGLNQQIPIENPYKS